MYGVYRTTIVLNYREDYSFAKMKFSNGILEYYFDYRLSVFALE